MSGSLPRAPITLLLYSSELSIRVGHSFSSLSLNYGTCSVSSTDRIFQHVMATHLQGHPLNISVIINYNHSIILLLILSSALNQMQQNGTFPTLPSLLPAPPFHSVSVSCSSILITPLKWSSVSLLPPPSILHVQKNPNAGSVPFSMCFFSSPREQNVAGKTPRSRP